MNIKILSKEKYASLVKKQGAKAVFAQVVISEYYSVEGLIIPSKKGVVYLLAESAAHALQTASKQLEEIENILKCKGDKYENQ